MAARTNYSPDEIARKDSIFQDKINKAGTSASDISKEEAKIFYGSTQKYWEGLPIEKRNQAIKDRLHVQTIEQAWNKVYKNAKVQNALDTAIKNQKPISTEQDIPQSNDEKDEQGSPPYMIDLIVSLDSSDYAEFEYEEEDW